MCLSLKLEVNLSNGESFRTIDWYVFKSPEIDRNKKRLELEDVDYIRRRQFFIPLLFLSQIHYCAIFMFKLNCV